ncbi:hypothetical protein M8J75_016056 [Diaphorina citri]|nr:hypothetical protein M8J75_016056 [Diaphorina citri]
MSFHPDTILSKNGPLWSVWRAAHLISNVKKFEVMKVDIEETLDMLNIARRTLPLRTSAHLLLGAVRLHQRQVSYLLTDCESTVAALIHSTRPGPLYSPSTHTSDRLAHPQDINMDDPVNLELIPDIGELDFAESAARNQANVADITLREDEPFRSDADRLEEAEFFIDFPSAEEPGARRPPLFRGAEAFRGPISSTPRKQPRLADPLGVQGDLMGSVLPEALTLNWASSDFSALTRGGATTVTPGLQGDTEMEVEPQLQQPQMETPGMTLGPEEIPPVAPEGIPVAPSEAGDQAIASGGASGAPQARPARRARRRRPFLDRNTMLSNEQIRDQLNNPAPTLRELEYAPPIRRRAPDHTPPVYRIRTGRTGSPLRPIPGREGRIEADELLTRPGRRLGGPLARLFDRHLHTVPREAEPMRRRQARPQEEVSYEPRPQDGEFQGPPSEQERSVISDEQGVGQHAGAYTPLRLATTPTSLLPAPLNLLDVVPLLGGPGEQTYSFGSSLHPRTPGVSYQQQTTQRDQMLPEPQLVEEGGPSTLGQPVEQTPGRSSVPAGPQSPVSESGSQAEARVSMQARNFRDELDRVFAEGFESLTFDQMTREDDRKTTCQKFYSLLILKKQNAVDINQPIDYEAIFIRKGPEFAV